MYKLFNVYILITALMFGCSSEISNDITTTNQNPGNFTINVTNITSSSALLTWSDSIDPDGDIVSYSIYFNGNEISSGLKTTEFLIEKLAHETSYTGRVIANDERNGITERNFSFTTITNTSDDVQISWQKSLGGSNTDVAYAVIQTNDLGYLVAGSTDSVDGDISSNMGGTDCWIVKLDYSGKLIWEKSFGGSDQDVIHDIKETKDGGIIVGAFSSSVGGDVSTNNGMRDFLVFKLDSGGNIIWSTSIGGSKDDILESIIETSDGSFIAVGYTSSDNFNVLGQSDAWVVKLSNEGELLWQQNLGYEMRDIAMSIDETTDLGYIIGGFSESSKDKRNMWIFKLNYDGVLQWEKFYVGTENEEIASVSETSDNGYIISGYSRSGDGDIGANNGSLDAIVIKTNNEGDITWKKVFGGSDVDGLNEVKQTVDGGYIAIGGSRSSDIDVTQNSGAFDFLILKMGSNGEVLWQKNIGGIGDDIPYSVEQSQDGGYIVAGSWYTNISGQGEGATGDDNFWVLKLE
ncbi:hypothetical protein BTO06_18175 [Tenacibaculum sp. SZ-18]|uniref:fibronectin type III domain-containing protein n=1 Tax=Tenacibaculum sp. SZ-18 TaxID=754423 RepID=UPI000C2CF75E|nr:fibronectin type III domain-containing protein [Tenacibaculum sp. SZ-18]AUC16956.1 hypothetical protein BTO06_18175 [Tenacibaculum sp. SZ-18]